MFTKLTPINMYLKNIDYCFQRTITYKGASMTPVLAQTEEENKFSTIVK